MTEQPAQPVSLEMQAAMVRDYAAREPDPLRRDVLAAATKTLTYISAHPALLHALAYWLKWCPQLGPLFEENPGIKFVQLNRPFEDHDDGIQAD